MSLNSSDVVLGAFGSCAKAETYADRRERIVRLEKAMFAMPENRIEIQTRHYFAPGLYAREVFIPAGSVVVGKIHTRRGNNVHW